MEKRSGISIISLAIMIVVMIAIASTAVVSTKHIMSETRKDKFVSELELVESNVKTYMMRTSGNHGFNIVSWDLTDIYDSEQFTNETITNNILTVYEVDLNKIDVEDTVYGKKSNSDSDDVYLVSIETGKVYYKKGYVYNDKTYYTITEDIK